MEVLPTAVERSLGKLGERRPDAIVLNPARAGARESVLQMVGDSSARQVVYLSCEPATLCRDLDLLARYGYETASVQPIDMMPQTKQIEALALLRAVPGARPRPTARTPTAKPHRVSPRGVRKQRPNKGGSTKKA